jgi:hypothetical protein
MARAYQIEHDDRLDEIDFTLSQGLPFRVIAAHFDFDERTVSRYYRRRLARDPRYFDKLVIGNPLPPRQVFTAASMYAETKRKSLLIAAEEAFGRI